MMWIVPLLGLAAGILLGSILSFQVPVVFAKYLSIAVLAALDSVLGGVRSIMEKSFNGIILITGVVSNALLAALLAYIGDRLGVDLYMAAIFVFGVRIFQNLAVIRHYLIARFMRSSTGVDPIKPKHIEENNP